MRPAFVGAALLYAAVAILLAAGLPAQVPVRFGVDLTADRWASRGTVLLGLCALGILLVGLFAGLAAQFERVLELGAATLLFLAVELALVYGGLTGGPGAGAAAEQLPARVPGWALVVLAAYLAHLLVWAGRQLTGDRAGSRQDRSTRGTADSAV